MSQADCQHQCTLLTDCVAYGENGGSCYLIPSSKNCTSDWSHGNTYYHVAASLEDLTVSNKNGTCTAKSKVIMPCIN